MRRPGTVTYPKNVGPWDLEPYYSHHVGAMTSEGLHAKADIAFQLALRDKEIALLRAQLLDATRKPDAVGAAVEEQRQLAARLGATMCAGVVVEPQGAPQPDPRCPSCGSINPELCRRMGHLNESRPQGGTLGDFVTQASHGWIQGSCWLFEQFPDAVAVWGPHESDWVLEDASGNSSVFGQTVLDRNAEGAQRTWVKRDFGTPSGQRFERHDTIFSLGR